MSATAPSSVDTPLPWLQFNNVPRNRDSRALPPTPPPESPVTAPARTVSRLLGDSELSYFLPSRADGVNDMYLHLGLNAPNDMFVPARVEPAWALMRLRHPLLASTVSMPAGVYTKAAFIYTPPADVKNALSQARHSLQWSSDSAEVLIDAYLNGPRTLSQSHLSHLIVSCPSTAQVLTPPGTPNLGPVATFMTAPTPPATTQVDLLICAAHFIGDGMALHTFANEFLQLLAGPDPQTGDMRTAAELACLLAEESVRCFAPSTSDELPISLEDGLARERSGLAAVAAQVDFHLEQRKCIGGHTFPRATEKRERRTILQTKTFDKATTSAMLKACKANGANISHALFAACNVAWARMLKHGHQADTTQPIMMYSAMNLRPYLPRPSSYWFLSVGYFNVVLPSFLPSTTTDESTFWHRARSAKAQSAAATNTRMLVPRASTMATLRGVRARTWAREDDGLLADPADSEQRPTVPELSSSAPSRALLGLSLLGNLDGMYKHATYPAITLHTLNTGSRQRPAGMLLFSYTFAGRLWLSFGWDVHGFDTQVVQTFWDETAACLTEFLAA